MSIAAKIPGKLPQQKTDWLAIPGLTSSLLLYWSFFPLSLGWLGWIALVPWLWMIQQPIRPGILYLTSWFCGLIFFIPALQWMRVADPMMYFTWIGLALYCSLYFPLALFLLRKIQLPLFISFPMVWVALEFLRSRFLEGFSWYLLAHTQHDCLPIIQIADLGGSYGVSFLVGMVNGLAAEILNGKFRQRKAAAVITLGLIVAALLYGQWRLSQGIGQAGPLCAALQGNVAQGIRNDPNQRDPASAPYIALSDFAAASSPDLIIWPETSYPIEWHFIEESTPADKIPPEWRTITRLQKGLGEEAKKKWGTSILLGLNSQGLGPKGMRRFNSALLVHPDGTASGRYDKIHRVPFGEYIPFKDWFPWLKVFSPYDFEYSISKGDGHPVLQFPQANSGGAQYRFGALICYEDTDPWVPLPYFSQKDPPGFLVNLSNDGWFKGSEEHEQHLAISRFRAIECRRALVRSVNMGISALIDGNGKVLAPESVEMAAQLNSKIWKIQFPSQSSRSLPLREWPEFKSCHGCLLARVPLDVRMSLYAKTGDILPWLCWLSWACFWFSNRRKLQHAPSH
ncbi:MAG: apolipoprotein N-acyltransferase [Gemmataceae bacterium]|nr:apolipoprotein N-acyltransferase [Gemmataceae bacterium]